MNLAFFFGLMLQDLKKLKNIKRTLLKNTESCSQNEIDIINEILSTIYDLYPTLK